MKVTTCRFSLFAILLLFGVAGCKERAVAVRNPAVSLEDLGAAPAWTLPDVAGKPVSSATYAGKVVVVDFWATWCAPCLEEIPGYVALQKKYADRGLVVVGISMDRQGADVVTPFAEKHGINYPLVIGDSEVADAFGGVEYLPTTYLIDREGRIRHRKVGAMTAEEYEQLVTTLL